MPKDIAKEAPEDMLVGSALSTTTRVSGRTVVRASTLTEMWAKRSSNTSRTKSSTVTDVVAAIGKGQDGAPTAGPSSNRKLSQTQASAVTQAVLESLEKDTMGETWLRVLSQEFKKPYFVQLKRFLLNEHASNIVFPTVENIYSWSRLTPLDEVKVVILGQDPYHNVGQAHGLSFSVLPPTKPPASLKNIYKQLEADFPGFKTPMTGDLSPIAKQGVLWLNTSLTVRAHKAGSHARKGWETFTTQVIRAVIQREIGKQKGVVFMAWGLPAQKTFSSIGIDEKKHLLLKSAHPSPLSAHRGFLGNGHFRKANEWLAERYGKDAVIDWTVLSAK